MNFPKKLKEFVTLGSSNLISSIILGLFWLFLASILTKTEYGELGYLMAVVNIASGISLLGLRATLMVYVPKNENIIPASAALVLITSIISAIVVFVFIQNFFVSLAVVGMSFFHLSAGALLSKEKYGTFSKYKLLQAGVAVIASLVFYQIFGINGIFLGYFLSFLFILKDLVHLVKNKKIEFSKLRSKIPFMIYAYSTRLSGVFFLWGDKLVIGAMFGLTMLANYHFAAQYLFLLETIPRSMGEYLLPQEAGGQLNIKTKQFFIGLSCLIAVISIIVIPYGVNTFLPTYEESILPMQIMSVAIIPLSIAAIQRAQFMGKENSRIVLIGSVIQTGFYLVLVIILGQVFGIVGLAYGFLSAAIFISVFNYFVNIHMQNNSKANHMKRK